MEGFWIGAARLCGAPAVAGFVAYTIYPQIIASPHLKNFTHIQILGLLGLISVLVFVLCLAIINSVVKRVSGNNTVKIKNSTVIGNIQAGNNTTHNKNE